MANELAIQAEGLGKRYALGARASYHRFSELLSHAARRPFRCLGRRGAADHSVADAPRETWALKDASFDVGHGEVVGIVGRNGAGKSTLLKILSRITAPTCGEARIYGRVGSLLEVGTGFHPELTGRENIFLNGAVLGMTRSEIRRKFDEIVAFSEVERFLDTPIKRYSSGMYMRLAFAVAAHLEPEILIVDEVLAVGDAAFQKKCLGKMGDFAESGRTVLFVSHNMTAVQDLCPRTILLDEGRVERQGPTAEVVEHYLKKVQGAVRRQVWDDVATAPGNDTVRLRSVELRTAAGSRDVVTTTTPIELVFEYWNLQPGARLNLSLTVFAKGGVLAFKTGPTFEAVWHGKPFPGGLFRSVCHIPGNLLNDGRHSVTLVVALNQHELMLRLENVLVFDVVDDGSTRGEWHGDIAGAVRPILDWETDHVEEGVMVHGGRE